MKDNTRVIAALLIGAAAGAALGLLFAPGKGEELRSDIADYIDDMIGNARETAMSAVNNAKNYGSRLYDEAKSKMNDVSEEMFEEKGRVAEAARAKGRQIRQEAHRRADEAKAHLKNGSNEVKESAKKA